MLTPHLIHGNFLDLVMIIMHYLKMVVLEVQITLEILNRYLKVMVVFMHQVLMNLVTLKLVILLTLKTELVISPLVVLLKLKKLHS